MNSHSTTPDKTIAALIHVSAFSKYIIPLGNFILPLILWTAKKNDPFVDENGKQALNFQISIFLYFILLVCLAIAGIVFLGANFAFQEPFVFSPDFTGFGDLGKALPLLFYIGFIGILLLGLFILEIVCVITATVKASEGHVYKYPITINFITPTPLGDHQSKNEQFNNTQNQRP